MKLVEYCMYGLLSVLVVNNVKAQVIESIESVYLVNAPQELVTTTENAAQLFEFTQGYELVVPKKAGVQINPWNKFVAYAINPQTNNPLIIVNPDWFNSLPGEQQTFLLGRCFETFKLRSAWYANPVKVTPLVLIVLRILLLISLFFVLGLTGLAAYSKLIRVAVAWVILFGMNLLVINSFESKLITYFAKRHDLQVIQAVIQKTNNKQAAIDALESFDTAIKTGIKNGEQLLVSHATLFEDLANQLKK